MAKDVTYTGGVIAVKENSLLKDKIFKLCETGAEEAFRAVVESGFGKGSEAESVYEYERLLSADESDLDVFVREYAPTKAEKEYLLSPRDFHNAKALVKALCLDLTADELAKLLAPEGLFTVTEIAAVVKGESEAVLNKELNAAIDEAKALFPEEETETSDKNDITVSGAQIGQIFDKALYVHLRSVCAGNGFLRKLVSAKADMTNILIALRSLTPEYAADNYVCGGKLNAKQLKKLFDEDIEKVANCLSGTPYGEFAAKCFAQKNAGLPMTEAERALDSFETDILSAKKYELKKSQPFLYYVFRRRAENSNLRILFVCLLAGMGEQEIKKRLRSSY